jgi:hypothetical protein
MAATTASPALPTFVFSVTRLIEESDSNLESPPEATVRKDAEALASLFRRLIGVLRYFARGEVEGLEEASFKEWGYLAPFFVHRWRGDVWSEQREELESFLEKFAAALEERAQGLPIVLGFQGRHFLRDLLEWVGINPPPESGAGEY